MNDQQFEQQLFLAVRQKDRALIDSAVERIEDKGNHRKLFLDFHLKTQALDLEKSVEFFLKVRHVPESYSDGVGLPYTLPELLDGATKAVCLTEIEKVDLKQLVKQLTDKTA